ncbi:hypothetical protein [Cetobacterium sp.]|uniref:hypothetical protein n=1 Tax=Cetobacterium sp. TaxID=2071632 RepID=UPI003F366F83
MNEKDFNEQEYLKACLIRDMLNAKGMVATYVNITEVMKKEKEKLQQEVEDWKYKCGNMDNEMCELKKDNVRLKEKEIKVIPLLEAENKREEYVKELENKIKLFEEDNNILNDKIKDLEQELLKKVIVECEPKKKCKPGRKPGVKK